METIQTVKLNQDIFIQHTSVFSDCMRKGKGHPWWTLGWAAQVPLRKEGHSAAALSPSENSPELGWAAQPRGGMPCRPGWGDGCAGQLWRATSGFLQPQQWSAEASVRLHPSPASFPHPHLLPGGASPLWVGSGDHAPENHPQVNLLLRVCLSRPSLTSLTGFHIILF